MEELRSRRPAADHRQPRPRRSPTLLERPDRLALWALGLSIVAMIAGVASAQASSSGGALAGAGNGSGGDEAASLNWLNEIATWYGPGLFGNETACGKLLTRRTMGVAHRTLPCGSRVVLRYRGRHVRTRVIDRGPFSHGARWDLTQATARALRLEATDSIRVAKLGP
jgi:hypothetical protein